MASSQIKIVEEDKLFESIGFSVSEAKILAIKSRLMADILKIIKQRGLRQADVAKIWEQSQPRVSEVVSGKIDLVSIDKLVDYLERLGGEVQVQTKLPKKMTSAKK